MDVREKLVELIEQSGACFDCFPVAGYEQEEIQKIASHLIANGVTVQEWISVKDRLPEEGTGKVLVVKQYRGKPYIDVGEVINGEACCYADEYAINSREHIFTHWMPLPQPPKGE